MFHILVMREMRRRGFKITPEWENPLYRGKRAQAHAEINLPKEILWSDMVYPEHNEAYLNECLENLKGKGIKIPIPS